MYFNEGHVPVLLNEFLCGLSEAVGLPARAGRESFIDFTFGMGGHSIAAIEKYEWLKIIAFDADPAACAHAESKYAGYIKSGRLSIINANFTAFDSLISPEKLSDVFGAIADFGISNSQLFEKGRGFSFDDDGALDMRLNPAAQELSAADAVNGLTEKELADIFYNLADERLSRQIARALIAERGIKKIDNCRRLADIVRSVYKRHPYVKTGVDFATKTIMALRIFVNSELDNIKTLLSKTSTLFGKNSRLFTITFHSNEDRIVKEFIKRESRGCVCPPEILMCRCGHSPLLRPVNKKPVCAREEEININPRSRSAKMRIIEFTRGPVL